MSDGPDHAPSGLELMQGVDRIVESVRVECSESFIYEQRFEAVTRSGSSQAHDIGESESQSERGLELFTARE